MKLAEKILKNIGENKKSLNLTDFMTPKELDVLRLKTRLSRVNANTRKPEIRNVEFELDNYKKKYKFKTREEAKADLEKYDLSKLEQKEKNFLDYLDKEARKKELEDRKNQEDDPIWN